MTLTIEAWIIPAIITIASFSTAFAYNRKADGIAAGFVYIGTLAFASIMSLSSWLVWALLS